MTWTPKPSNRAFIVDASKMDDFLNNNRASAKETMKRYYKHHPEKLDTKYNEYDGKNNA